ncbi:MAG TPA: rRNA maturation RNase YbeY [Acidimicrobiales bacterium]|nr:rRNA maturation RNase YbeY [Acidimicrobiales bacterium]
MTVEVFAADEQGDVAVDTLRWVRLAEAVLADEGIAGDAELSLLFVDEDAIADLNQRFLGKEGPTDVLAFPIDEEPAESGRSPDSGGTGPGFAGEVDEAPTLLGDVVICPKVAVRNAPDHAGSYDDEMALLIVHGVLHLLGLDHMDEEEAAEMEGREAELLTRHHGITPGSKLADLRALPTDRPDRPDRPDRAAKPDKAASPNKAAKPDQPDGPDQPGRSERPDRPEDPGPSQPGGVP